MRRSEEQAGRNEVSFREANEQINRKGGELAFAGRLPFLCECEEPTCTEIVQLTAAEYERARSNARWFLMTPGHQSRASEPIETSGRFMIVEKNGLEGEIAEQVDPRSAA